MAVRFEKLAAPKCHVPECGGVGTWLCVEEVEGETIENAVCEQCAADFAELAGVELVEALVSCQ